MSTREESSNMSNEVSQKKQKIPQKSGLPGNHGKSQVWNYFIKLTDEGGKRTGKAQCKFCKEIVNAPSNVGTNSCWSHIKTCFEFKKAHNDSSQTLIGMIEGQSSLWMFDQNRCRKTLAKMIILCELPFNFVEKEGFRNFCSDLQPKFHVVSRTTITKDCLQIYYDEKNKLKEFMKLNTSRVSITTDMWTSNQNLGYMMLRLYQHYVSSTFVNLDLTTTSESDAICGGEGIKRVRKKDEFRAGVKRKEFVDPLSDLDRYLSEGIEDENPQFDVLLWWKEKLATYRSLAIMARDILSIPITSVASESAFSTAGRVLDPFRSSLTPRIVESLICTQDWIKNPTSFSVEQTLEELEEIENVVTREMEALTFGGQTSTPN